MFVDVFAEFEFDVKCLQDKAEVEGVEEEEVVVVAAAIAVDHAGGLGIVCFFQ